MYGVRRRDTGPFNTRLRTRIHTRLNTRLWGQLPLSETGAASPSGCSCRSSSGRLPPWSCRLDPPRHTTLKCPTEATVPKEAAVLLLVVARRAMPRPAAAAFPARQTMPRPAAAAFPTRRTMPRPAAAALPARRTMPRPAAAAFPARLRAAAAMKGRGTTTTMCGPIPHPAGARPAR